MQAHLIKYENPAEMADALLKAGCSAESLRYFENRRDTVQVYFTDIPSPAANIIKQEMLSRGGDAAVHALAVRCGVEHSDVILFGTKKQLGYLADKLETMPWWGLGRCAAEIRRLTASAAAKTMALPHGRDLVFDGHMLLMGIINLTDDSFYDKSRCGADTEATVRRAVQMAEEGADILDLGAESTRPGAARVPEETELERMSSAVAAIRQALPEIPVSVDTTRGSVALAALEAGADIINDVSGLSFDIDTAYAAAKHSAALIVMHMRGTPETMRDMCGYGNVISEVCSELVRITEKAEDAGVPKDRIIIDPGIGFAKNNEQNLELLRHCESFKALGLPLLIGASRKGFIGTVTGEKEAGDRLFGTLAVTAHCCRQKADIIRVHDVRANRDVIRMTEALWGRF